MYETFNKSKIYAVILIIVGILLILLTFSSFGKTIYNFLPIFLGVIIIIVGSSTFSLNRATDIELTKLRLKVLALKNQLDAIEKEKHRK